MPPILRLLALPPEKGVFISPLAAESNGEDITHSLGGAMTTSAQIMRRNSRSQIKGKQNNAPSAVTPRGLFYGMGVSDSRMRTVPERVPSGVLKAME